MVTVTKKKVCRAMAQSMRDFGYPDCTDEMAGEVLDAYAKGKRGMDELPHDVIGAFLERQLDELENAGVDLMALANQKM